MIYVIGGSGFVGSRLISEIGEKNCINIDKNKSPFYNSITVLGNIMTKSEIKIESNAKTVVLLAAEHRDDVSPKSLYYDVNVEGTKNVLKTMDAMGVKSIIFTSSVAVYGLNKNNPDENFPKDPFNHYGKSKWEAEKVLKDWYESDPINKSVTIIRPTVIFGERNRGNVYNLLRQISSGAFVKIGKGKNKKSMAYVGNVVDFIADRINKKTTGFQVYNYVDKPDFNMNDLISIVEKKVNRNVSRFRLPEWLGISMGYVFDFASFLSGKKLAISSVRVKKFCATTQFNAEKANKVYSPKYTLEEGLNKTLEFEFLEKDKDDVIFYSE
jgi:GlcNAc-P-P-Und epimerase